MRMSLWISNYDYPEKDQKTLWMSLQAMDKMATAVKLLHSLLLSVYGEKILVFLTVLSGKSQLLGICSGEG